MNLTPKEFFQKSPVAKWHLDLTADARLHDSLQIALLEMSREAVTGDAAENWHKLKGAQRFIEIWLNLSEIPQPAKRIYPRENLQPV